MLSSPNETGGMWKEFKEFAVKGSAIDLAVGVIIGAAFGRIVTSIVEDLLMPPIGRVAGNLDFSNLYLPLSDKIKPVLPLAEAKGINKMKQPKSGPPVVKDCPACTMPIPIKATRCPHCTTEFSGQAAR